MNNYVKFLTIFLITYFQNNWYNGIEVIIMDLNKWKLVKKDENTYEFKKPEKPEITPVIVLALLFLMLFVKKTEIYNFFKSFFD
jgi:hypothetical protein